ncbi:MAG: PAS domain-containing protein, partial [Deltaproteobacteria bacterium]|nr:PAS domain-containing protein [Deltaproteobacteria bacterium]
EEIANEIMHSLNKDGTWSGEVLNIKKDGTTFWCHANVTTFTHHTLGEVWVSVHEDITDRKLVEDKLRAANQQLKEVNKKLMDAYALMRKWKDHLGTQLQAEHIGFLVDKNGLILAATQRALEVTGRTRLETIGTNLVDLMEGASKEKLEKALSVAWTRGFYQRKVWMTSNQSEYKSFVMKLMHMHSDRGRTLLVLEQESRQEGEV